MISAPGADNRRVVSFMGVSLDDLDAEGLLERVIVYSKAKMRRKIMYMNADCTLLAMRDRQYMAILNRADLVYADGVGVVLGARLFGERLPGRMTGADFMPDFCDKFEKSGLSIFLLGGREGVAAKAAQKLKQRCPGLKVAGTHHGYFDHERSSSVIEAINRANPHILLVAFGAPHQEKWIDRNAGMLDVPVVWGVGGLFDFLSGNTRRGPKWLLDNGFEWLCRLMAEPQRLWKRYLVGNSRFVLYLLYHRFISKKYRGFLTGTYR